jgi:prepilin-type N-terminal cleavage/methylation domain-containing protein
MPKAFGKILSSRTAFTLTELLVVIGILAILSAAAVVIVDPAEYFKQSRDSQRIADLKNIQSAVFKYKYSGDRIGSLGNTNTVYVSLVDIGSAQCVNLGLPSLSGGWQYHCLTSSANLQKVDGTGWLPVDLSTTGVMASLPLDPTSDSSYFYAYIVSSSGSIELVSGLESQKYLAAIAATDGGADATHFETGEDLTLWKTARGL